MSNRIRIVFILSILLIVLTTIPYVYGYLARPDGTVYSGLHYLITGDNNTYFSMIEQVKQGHVGFLNLYTPEIHARTYVNVLWLGIGILAKIFSLSPVFAFQLARIILIPFLVYVVVRILEYFFSNEHRKVWIGSALVFFSSGIGLFVDGFLSSSQTSIQHPVDMWVPEAIPFLTVLQSPHLIASLALLIAVMHFGLRAFLEKKKKYAWYSGIASLVLFSIHPFYVPTVYAVLGVSAVIIFLQNVKKNKHIIGYIARIIAVSAPILFYFLWLDRSSEVFHVWSSQNILASPSFLMYLYGFGLLVPFAVYGGIKTWNDPKIRFVSYWALANLVLLYTPFSFQRRLIEGLAIPISILALVGIWRVVERARKKSWNLAVAVVISLFVFLPLGNWQVLLQDIHNYNNRESPYTYFYYPPTGDIEAMTWLKKNANDSDVILSSFFSGNFIPAYSGRRVFAGHNPQTIDPLGKKELLNTFFSEETQDAERKDFLEEWHITYLFYSENEKIHGSFDPHAVTYLEEVYATETASVFQIRLGDRN